MSLMIEILKYLIEPITAGAVFGSVFLGPIIIESFIETIKEDRQ